jgi:REase_DpnII-MboI
MNPEVNSLLVLGNVLEEFMDVARNDEGYSSKDWQANRDKVVRVLEDNGFRYYRGGRVLPAGEPPEDVPFPVGSSVTPTVKPSEITELLEVLVKGLRRAMHPLTHRRKGAQSLSFSTEYDVQDLLHALLRPWVADIRPEEFTPSYAGSTTRMDFLLPKYGIVIELKFVRDKNHAKKIGDGLIIDVSHYQSHPGCRYLWCVVFDQDHLLPNAAGLKNDLEGERSSKEGKVLVKVAVL